MVKVGKTFLMAILLSFVLGVCALFSGCSTGDASTSEVDINNDFVMPSPQTAVNRGNDAVVVPYGEVFELAGLSDYEQRHPYDGLEMSVVSAEVLEKQVVYEQHPVYAADFAFNNVEQKFIFVTINLVNHTNEAKLFELSEMKLYSNHFSDEFWVKADDALLSSEYGNLSDKKSKGTWGYPEDWNVINPGESKQYKVPFVILNSKSGLEALEDYQYASTETFQLMMFNAYTDKEIRQSKSSQDCILFDLA